VFGKNRIDVLVIGAGPVGLLTALRLSKQGLKVQIVDKHRRTGVHSYALALHPQSLRLLDELGLATKLMDSGRRIDRISFLEGDKPHLTLSFDKLPGKFPYVLVAPQRVLESVLEEQLTANRVKVQWNHRVQEIVEEADGVRTEIARLDQAPSGYPIARLEWVVDKILETRSDFVVGADGYHSLTRGQLGLQYNQIAEEQVFSVFEFEAAADPGNEVRVLLSKGGTSVLWPMAGRRCRWSFQIDRPEDHRPQLAGLNALLRERAPWFPQAKAEIHWQAVVHFDRRLTERFGRGRVWLAGDSAHLTSPVGVQSLNVGLAEAWTLSRLLAEQRAASSSNVLEQYNTERLREWRALLGVEGGVQAASSADAWTREHAAEILACVPASGEELTRLLEQAGLEFRPPRSG